MRGLSRVRLRRPVYEDRRGVYPIRQFHWDWKVGVNLEPKGCRSWIDIQHEFARWYDTVLGNLQRACANSAFRSELQEYIQTHPQDERPENSFNFTLQVREFPFPQEKGQKKPAVIWKGLLESDRKERFPEHNWIRRAGFIFHSIELGQ